MSSVATITETGLTIYVVFRDVDSQLWNDVDDLLEAFTPTNYTEYAVAAAEQGTTGYYYAGTPALLPIGTYRLDWRAQAGGSPAQTDLCVACGSAYWNGIQWLSFEGMDRVLTLCVGDVSDAKMGVEHFSYAGIEAEITVDEDGNRTLTWSNE
jgi:hypothetical protein